MPVTAPEGARCGTHAERPAVDICSRCGAFVCGECAELFQDTLYCSACHALVRPQEVSRRSRWALRLGFGALVLPVLMAMLKVLIEAPFVGIGLGASAVIMARMELAAIARKEAPLGGRRRSIVAMVLGLVSVALWLGLLVLALLVARSIFEHD